MWILYPMFTCRKIVCLKHGRHLAASLNSSLDIWQDNCGLQEMWEGEFLPFLRLTYIIWLWVKSMVFWWSPEKPVFWGDHPHQTWHSNAFDRYWSIHITWLSSRPKCPQGSPFLRRSPCGACWQGGRGRGFIYLVLPLSYLLYYAILSSTVNNHCATKIFFHLLAFLQASTTIHHKSRIIDQFLGISWVPKIYQNHP